MSIKSVAHRAHQLLASAVDPAFKRSHFYELTAAAFGYGSYAALGAESVLFNARPPTAKLGATQVAGVRERCVSLGYPALTAEVIADEVCKLLSEQCLGAIRLVDLVHLLRQRNHDDDGEADDELDAPDHENRFEDFTLPSAEELPAWILLEGLRGTAQRGSALAHYAIALLHEPDRYAAHESRISPYWHTQRQASVELVGVQIEWADAYERQESSKTDYEFHLRAAAKLGYKDALLDLAEHFGDPAVFDVRLDLSDKDPTQMAQLAKSLGRSDEAKRWLTITAESGNTEAMRDLIEGGDSGDLRACWKWIYLAKLYGTDLTADDYHAINEDGSAYDDDVGGPVYADGRDGIELEGLSPEDDRIADLAAREIYERNGDHLEADDATE